MTVSKQSALPPRILVLSASVGAGHNAVARALVEGLTAAGADANWLDVLEKTGRLFRSYYAGGFALAMAKFPGIYGLAYRLTNRPQGSRRRLLERRRLWTERYILKGVAQYILANPVDLVVHTHFLAAPMLGRMMRSGRFGAPQVVVVTDVEVHRFWHAEGVHHWFVPAAGSAARLRRWGIPDERITVSGIPIHSKWTAPLDRRKILDDWKLPTDRKIVLLSGGVDFTCGPIVRIARGLLDGCPDACVVVLGGHNKKLLGRLARLGDYGGRLVPVAFTDRPHELAEVCSLMITKAGGVTTAECLAKGIAMVLLPPVPGHEAGNARHFASQGAAIVTCGVTETIHAAGGLLSDSAELARMSEHARRLYQPARQTVVDAVIRMARARMQG